MKVNIPVSIPLESHPFKRDQLEVKAVNQTNGESPRTEIVNAILVGKQTHLIPDLMMMRLARKLGTRTHHFRILDGQYSLEQVEAALEEIIQEEVLCPHCHGPDTVRHMRTIRKLSPTRHCNSCGWNRVFTR